MKEKVLVCVLCETREHNLVWKNFKKFVLDNLNADLALCISAPLDYDYSNQYWQHAKYKWTSPEYENWSDALDYAKEIDFENVNDDWKKFLTVQGNCLAPINRTPGNSVMSVFFRWFLAHNLVKENLINLYDRFIIIRSDFLFLSPHPPLKYLDPKYIWVTDGEYYTAVTDRYACVSKNHILQFLSTLKNIMTNDELLWNYLLATKNPNLEYLIWANTIIELGNIYKVFPYIMYTLRSYAGKKSIYSDDFFAESLGHYIKYKSEYCIAKENESLYKTNEDWKNWYLKNN
jgi:hypothetical protein